MMGPTHRALGSTWWLGGVLAANAMGAGIDPVTAGLGALVAPVFAAGRLSPDADTTWLRHLGHRQVTHRPWVATALTGVSLGAWLGVLIAGHVLDGPAATVLLAAHWLAWAPVSGWWSHLGGDAAFGRIPLGRRTGEVLERIIPRRLTVRLLCRSKGRQPYWLGLGWDTDGVIERGKIYVSHLPPWLRMLVGKPERTRRGLHTTVRVLPFAPTTLALQAATVGLYVAVVALWIRSGSLT